ncbi:hypothetical protein ACMFMG_007803 [Clarireedia jacksonii]
MNTTAPVVAVSGIRVGYMPNNNLWQQALQTLSDEDKGRLAGSTDKLDILDEILDQVKAKKEICLLKRWKYTNNKGEIVIIRDMLDKITTWIQKFKDIGDIVVQYDPSHAALPWAGIRFLLQIAVNDSQTFGAMCEGIESISNLISRCATIELRYLGCNVNLTSTVKNQLETSLVRLYSAVLTFLSQAKQYYSQNTAARLLKSSFKPPELMVDTYLKKISKEQVEVNLYTRLLDAESIQNIHHMVDSMNQGFSKTFADITKSEKQINDSTIDTLLKSQQLVDIFKNGMQDMDNSNTIILKKIESMDIAAASRLHSLNNVILELRQPIWRSATQLSELHDQLKRTNTDAELESERREILQWVSKIQYKNHHKSIGNNILDGSGQWLRHKVAFIEWRRSSVSSILWLHGIPGSGKSKLIYSIIEFYINNIPDGVRPAPIAYFYCTRNPAEPERANPDEILSCILKQLSCSTSDLPIREPLVNSYQIRKKEAEDDGCDPLRLTTAECVDVILALLKENPGIIFIDALDECDPLRRHELLEALDIIITRSENLVKVLVSSRDDNDIVCRLENSPNVHISASDNEEDIIRFVHWEVERSIRNKRLLTGLVSDDMRSKVTSVLTHGAHGMFRWVSLQIQNLCDVQRIKHEKDVEQELGRLPTTLRESYDVIFTRILNSSKLSKRVAENAMKWLMCAQRPLNADEFLDAVSLEPNGNRISLSRVQLLDMCCNLVVWDRDSKIFRFAHLSVREYLEDRIGYSQEDTHLLAAERCLIEFMQGTKPIDDSKAGLRPYATLHWPVHAQHLEIDSGISAMKNSTSFFILTETSDPPFSKWMSAAISIHRSLERSNPLAAFLADSICEPPSPLFVGCVFGLVSILDNLESNKFVDWNQVNWYGYTGLHLGIIHGHESVVHNLLQRQVDTSILDKDSRTALSLAASMGNKEMIRLLLDSGACIDSQDFYGKNALHYASEHGNVAVIQYLIDKGADPEAETRSKETPIYFAARHGHEQALTIFLNERVKTSIKTTSGHTALFEASERGHEKIVLLLLDNGAEIEARTISGHTAIHRAIAMGHTKIFTLLLDRYFQAVKTRKDSHMETIVPTSRSEIMMPSLLDTYIMHLVVEKLDAETLAFILDHTGRDVVITEEILKAAASNISSGKEVMMVLFERRGPEVLVIEEVVKAAAANSRCGQEVMKVFCQQQEYTVPITKGVFETAAANLIAGGEIMMFMFEQIKGDVSLIEKVKQWNILHVASGNGNMDAVKALIMHQVEVNTEDADGWTALHFASEKGYFEVVKFLVEHAAELNAQTETSLTPLHLACKKDYYKGHLEVVKLLLEKGADMSVPDENGWTPLNSACDNGHLEVVKLLLEKDADLSVASNNGWTPLNSACDSGHLEVVKLLLEKGADLSIDNDEGSIPLYSACQRGHLEVMKLLLEKDTDLSVASNDGWTLLDSVSANGHLEVATLLHLASIKGYTKIVKFLVEHQVELDTQDTDGHTALHFASENGRFEVVKFLIKHGAEVNIKGDNGQTPLMCAIVHRHDAVVELLLAADNINPNLKDENGQTPLLYAVENELEVVVQLLLEHNVDTDAEDSHGWNALQRATLKGYRAIERLFAINGSFGPDDFFGLQMLFREQ